MQQGRAGGCSPRREHLLSPEELPPVNRAQELCSSQWSKAGIPPMLRKGPKGETQRMKEPRGEKQLSENTRRYLSSPHFILREQQTIFHNAVKDPEETLPPPARDSMGHAPISDGCFSSFISMAFPLLMQNRVAHSLHHCEFQKTFSDMPPELIFIFGTFPFPLTLPTPTAHLCDAGNKNQDASRCLAHSLVSLTVEGLLLTLTD